MRKTLILSGHTFKDCSASDFEHYFTSTILLWKLSPTKNRIFICAGLGPSGVTGQYLTRQKELKDKHFPMQEWWKHLDLLPPYSKVFNLVKTAVIWQPNMSKNLRKSFPALSGTSQPFLHPLGKPTAEEGTLQNILASAFDEFYMFRSLPTLRDAMQPERLQQCNSVACQGDLVVTNSGNILFKDKSNSVGKIVGGTVQTHSPSMKELLVDVGALSPSSVIVVSKS